MSDNISELVNGVISTKRLGGAETFKKAEGSLLAVVDILDYWSWVYSDIVGNTNRGALAEFIVARAIGSEGSVRNDWAAYDLERPSEIKVEVKSSAYLQSWHQTTISAPPSAPKKHKDGFQRPMNSVRSGSGVPTCMCSACFHTDRQSDV